MLQIQNATTKNFDRQANRGFGSMQNRFPVPSGATSPSNMGSSTHCGGALVTEIDSYRRRIQTLIHFFDCIAQHWWDQLYPYKKCYIKRPSKSADEVRSYRSRLTTRLNRFTKRSVIPDAAAVATLESHASVKVLPEYLLNQMTSEFASADIPNFIENAESLLRKAFNLARRLSDIEKLKQRLILSALTWITSDGRDFALRTQRVALLVRHVEPCLIEHYDGVRALITHYYRPRVLSRTPDDSKHSTIRAEPITAERLTRTNEQILQAVRSVCTRMYPSWSTETTVTGTEPDFERLSPPSTSGYGDQTKSSEGTLRNDPFTMMDLFSYNAVERQPRGPASQILPTIVFNPLTIDTSQVDWLSYEINSRDLNLYVINMEEPDNVGVKGDEPNKLLIPTKPVTSTKDLLLPWGPSGGQLRKELPSTVNAEFRNGLLPKSLATTSFSSPVTNDTDWSGESHTNRLQDSTTNVTQALQDSDVKAMVPETSSATSTQIEVVDGFGAVLTSRPKTHSVGTPSSGDTLASLLGIGIRSRTIPSPGGAGEGPIKNLLTMPNELTPAFPKLTQSTKGKKNARSTLSAKNKPTDKRKTWMKQSTTPNQTMSITEKNNFNTMVKGILRGTTKS